MNHRERSYLFVCGEAKNRSPSAARIFKGWADSIGIPVTTSCAQSKDVIDYFLNNSRGKGYRNVTAIVLVGQEEAKTILSHMKEAGRLNGKIFYLDVKETRDPEMSDQIRKGLEVLIPEFLETSSSQ